MLKYRILTIFSLTISLSVLGQDIDLKQIMKGNEFIGFQPETPFWSHDSKTIFFDWKKEGDFDYRTYQYAKGNVSQLPYEDYSNSMMEGYKRNGKILLFASAGRLYQFNMASGEKQLLIYSNKLKDYYFTDEEGKYIVNLDQEFYLLTTQPFSLVKWVEFGKFSAKSEETEKSFLENQQEELFEIVRFRKKQSEFRKEKREGESNTQFHKINVEQGYWLNAEISRDLSYLAYVRSVDPKVKDTEFFQFITSDGEAESNDARPKVGRPDPECYLNIYYAKDKENIQFDPSILSGIKKRPLYFKDYEKKDFKEESDEPKQVIYHNIQFSNDSKKLLFEVKSFDNKDRWIVVYDFEKKKYIEVDHQHDEAWIGGPGIVGWTTVGGNMGWFKDSDRIYFQSEASGYSHLYVYSLSKAKTNQLTKGEFEIHEANLSNDNAKFYVIANKEHAGNREFYHVDAESGKFTTILGSMGNHEVAVSPDETMIAYRFSFKNKPWEIYTCPNISRSKISQVTKSTTKEFEAINWMEPEVIQFKAEDGTMVPARLYQPESEKFKEKKAVIFVHGAGYLQNAHNWWSAYYREFMFHNLLVSKGYTVLDIDYRASEGYGRKWRTDIYRNMGGKDVSDQVDGRKYLIEELGVPENKIGIYGGSYGGFVTIMSLLKYPGKFQCGAAIRSVTDWAHYNHPYTSNILNTPETDSIAYVRSSPIYYADKLQDPLLILHGMLDDNVQFQDVVRLVQRFIELEKDTYEMAIYPIEPHGFQHGTSWFDEYKRILKLFETHL
ncbi:MAG: prolyl oligopeptidase family serine peptidase [Crocinitomicaceae bacterium]